MSIHKWQRVVVHHSASHDDDGVDADIIRGWHLKNSWQDIGYHWVVERVGDVYHAIMGRPMDRAGAHCRGYNSNSIGVCFVGNFEEEAPHPDMLLTGVELISGLCASLEILPREIAAHNELSATLCPGRYLPIDDIRSEVKLRLA